MIRSPSFSRAGESRTMTKSPRAGREVVSERNIGRGGRREGKGNTEGFYGVWDRVEGCFGGRCCAVRLRHGGRADGVYYCLVHSLVLVIGRGIYA